VLDLEEADGGETPLRPRQCTWVEAMERAQKTAQDTPTPRTPFPWLDSTLAAGAVAPSLGGHGAAVFISMPNQLRLRFLYHGMFGRHGGWLMSPLSTLAVALSWFALARYTLGINNVAVTLGSIMCDPHGVAAALSRTGSKRSTRRHNVWVRLSLEEAKQSLRSPPQSSGGPLGCSRSVALPSGLTSHTRRVGNAGWR
jgi:hypothetical protein